MTRRRLSSALTFFWKVGVPLVWIPGIAACAVSAFFVTPGKPPDPELESLQLSFLGVSLVGAPIFLWFAAGLKRVRREGTDLLVSNYWRELRIPVTEIKQVYQSWAVMPWRVVIEMRAPTELGETFIFVPRFRDGIGHAALGGRHPVVEEIRVMCDAAR
ncbi:MAG TPA: hypothetical protein VFX87_00950 [Methylomirabilota bacterium]|nr:hypothetical protein [Methylomirabilota bacterium]